MHPPVLMVFDPHRGEYRRAEARCTARWAQSQRGHVAGQMCGQEATEQVGDTWVCDHHYQRARKWAKEMPKRDMRAELASLGMWHEDRMRREREEAKHQVALRREAAKLERELERERILAEDAARAELSVVYYIRRESDGLIKIGTTRGLPNRLGTLKRTYGPLRVLAAHGGGYKEEHALHAQFKAQRVTARGEWFRPELPLLEHIIQTRKADASRGPLPVECVALGQIRRMLRELKKEAEAA